MTVRLPPRQLEVAELVAEGLSNRQIARQLGISVHTVKHHILCLSATLNGRGSVRVRITRFIATQHAGST